MTDTQVIIAGGDRDGTGRHGGARVTTRASAGRDLYHPGGPA